MNKALLLIIGALTASSAYANVLVGMGSQPQKQPNSFEISNMYGQVQTGHSAKYYQNKINKASHSQIQKLTVHQPPKIIAKIKAMQQAKADKKFQDNLAKSEQTRPRTVEPAQPQYQAPAVAQRPTESYGQASNNSYNPTSAQTKTQQTNTNNVTAFSGAQSASSSSGGGDLGIQY